MTKQPSKTRPATKPRKAPRAAKGAPQADPSATAPDQATQANTVPRAGTKQAELIALLRRPERATVAEIMAITDWQAHTVRGAIAGALKKKLGLKVDSEKVEDRGRVYRIAD